MEEKVSSSDLDNFMSAFMGVSNATAEQSKIETVDAKDLDGKQLVAVKYRDKVDKTLFSSRDYTYYTKLPLQIGDIVKCPTKFGASIGKVSRLNVPEKEVEKFKDALKEIDEYYKEGEADGK